MPMTPGYYMPNPYGQQLYAMPSGAYSGTSAQQSYSMPQQPAQPVQGMIWVDGEVGAKAYQMPQGWPAGAWIPLWDTNDTVIYLKSTNQMGMPNPLQKIHYTMEENKSQQMLPAGQLSGSAAPESHDYATRNDLEQMKNEIKELLRQNQQSLNQNGMQNQQNRNGAK